MKKFLINVNGKSYDVEVTEIASDGAVAAPVMAAPQAPKAAAPVAAPAQNVAGTKVEAPMPGTILKVNVNVGDTVNEGDTVVVLEAMKMENEIVSPVDGTVTFVGVSKGATVESGSPICVIE